MAPSDVRFRFSNFRFPNFVFKNSFSIFRIQNLISIFRFPNSDFRVFDFQISNYYLQCLIFRMLSFQSPMFDFKFFKNRACDYRFPICDFRFSFSISKIRVFGFRFPNFDFRFSIVVVVTGAVWILNIRAGVMQRFGWD